MLTLCDLCVMCVYTDEEKRLHVMDMPRISLIRPSLERECILVFVEQKSSSLLSIFALFFGAFSALFFLEKENTRKH